MERYTQGSFRPPAEEETSSGGRQQRYLVIVNPVSRGGHAIDEGMWLLKQLRRLRVNHEAFITENPGHAEQLVKRAGEDFDVVVAVGGDGTVNEVVNGMMALPDNDKTFAVFPAGTADDYCHNVGIPREREPALEILLNRNDRMIDLIDYNGRYAVVQLGIGVDAEIAYRTLSHKNVRIAAYFAVGLRVVFKERLRNSPKLLHIESDNKVFDGRFLVTTFGNGPLYGRYVYWMPEALMDDGLLNFSAIRPMSPAAAWYLLMRSFNRDYRSEKLIYDTSPRFKVVLGEVSFLQVDGEVYRYDAGEVIEISTVPRRLKARIPAALPENAPFVSP